MPSFYINDGPKGSKAIAVVRGGKQAGDVIFMGDGKDGLKRIDLPDESKFEPLPNPDDGARDCYYIAGQSGAGKSYMARTLAENYRKMYPERPIVLVSKLTEDETLDNSKAKIGRVAIESLVKDPPAINEFNKTMVLFDDIDTLEKPYDEAVRRIMNDLLIMGRHEVSTVCVMSHYLAKDKKQALLLNEAHYIIVYPASTSPRSLKYVCESYAGLDPDQIKELKKLGRWVIISKNYPVWVMGQNALYFPHEN
jgi:hypothetical protein